MKRLYRLLSPKGSDSAYAVSKDGALVLDRKVLLESGKLNRQFDAARELRSQSIRDVSVSRFPDRKIGASSRQK